MSVLGLSVTINREESGQPRWVATMQVPGGRIVGHCDRGRRVRIPVLPVSSTLHEAMGTNASVLERSRLEAWLNSARRALGADAARTAWTDGMGCPIDVAVAEANAVISGAIEATPGAAAPAVAAAVGLTRRELEVLRLVAQHATDREVADALSISPRTVMHHVSHILAKLGVSSRRDAAVWAGRRGIA